MYKFRQGRPTGLKYTIKQNNRGWFSAENHSADKHPLWAGDNVGYRALHYWVESHLGRLGLCKECGANGKTHFANISRDYHRDLSDWVELCPKCHAAYDKRGVQLQCLV